MRRKLQRAAGSRRTRSRRRAAAAAITASAVLGAGIAPASASAAQFNIRNFSDSDGSGACDLSCNLREAVEAANDNPGPDVVAFAPLGPPGSGTVTLTNGPIVASGDEGNDLTITGLDDPADVVIDGDGGGGILVPAPVSGAPSELTIERLTFTDVDEAVDSDAGDVVFRNSAITGATSLDSGLSAAGDLLVEASEFSGNGASGGSGSHQVIAGQGDVEISGSAFLDNDMTSGDLAAENRVVFGSGSVSISGSTFDGNRTSGFSSETIEAPRVEVSGSTLTGTYSYAGVLDGTESLSVSGTTIRDNPDTGGFAVTGGEVAVTDSVIRDNFGTGIRLAGATRTLELRRSEISGNSAGGVRLEFGATGTITGSTISGNSTFLSGGGILATGYDALTIRNSTIVGNSSEVEGGGIFLDVGSESGASNWVATMVSTVVAGNDAPEGPDVAGAIDAGSPSGVLGASLSLIGDPEPLTVTDVGGAGVAPLQLGADPKLGPLSSNGGPTRTMLPADDSPLIDAGLSVGSATDQRGLGRIVDTFLPNAAGSDATDIGAVELESLTPPPNVAPETRITKAPKKKLKTKKSKKRVKVKFTGSDDTTPTSALGYECKLVQKGKKSKKGKKGKAWKFCDSPFKKKLKKGRYSFQVRAIDGDGARDPSPAKAGFKIKRK